MTSHCGKMSLLLPFIAMLVQNAFPSPTPQGELAAIDPFDNNIPAELKVPGWISEDPEDMEKLIKLALIGLNKIRVANGVTANLKADEEYMMNWSQLVSQHLGVLLTEQGDKFTLPKENDASVSFFGKIFDYKKEEQTVVVIPKDQGVSTSTEQAATPDHQEFKLTPVSTLSISDLLVESIRNWYKKTQADVKNGVKKESISVLDPDTEKIGLGFNKQMEALTKDKVMTYYNCLINFATQAQLTDFKKKVDETPDSITPVTP